MRTELIRHLHHSYRGFTDRLPALVAEFLFRIPRRQNGEERTELFSHGGEAGEEEAQNAGPEEARTKDRAAVKVGRVWEPVAVSKVRLLKPRRSEGECSAFRLRYDRPVIADFAVGHDAHCDVLLGFVPALTEAGTLLFGQEPVRERIAILRLVPKPEVRLARALMQAGESDEPGRRARRPPAEAVRRLERHNARYGTHWTFEELRGLDSSPRLENYHLLALGDALAAATRQTLRQVSRYWQKNPVASAQEVTGILLPCLPQMFAALLERHLAGSGLLQTLDRTNALAEVAHARKVTFCGPGGVRSLFSEKTPERMPHPTHRGFLCPVETPESARIGLNLHLALAATIPRGGERLPDGAQPVEMLGASAALIPFVEHDDMNRAMMGAKNMKQALPLVAPEPPLVKTGWEAVIAQAAQPEYTARAEGEITGLSQCLLSIHYKGDDKETQYPLILPGAHPGAGGAIYRPPSMGDALAAKPLRAGDLLARRADIYDGELALGVNLLVAYLPWYGYNFEDAVVVSERAAEKLTSLHIREEGGSPTLEARPLQVGDKLTGRHGNKGVVARILPEPEMPRVGDEPVEVLLNPHGVLSRMNVGQLLETHWGWIAKKQGPIVAPPFSLAYRWDALEPALAREGMRDGKAEVVWTRDGKECRASVVVGYQYLMKLNHCAADKLAARGRRGARNPITLQPAQGKHRGGGQRVGEMEVWALLGHGAAECLREILVDKSDAVWPGSAPGEPETDPTAQAAEDVGAAALWLPAYHHRPRHLPESLRVLLHHLRALGIAPHLRRAGSKTDLDIDAPLAEGEPSALHLRLTWATEEEVVAWAEGREIAEVSLTARGFQCPGCGRHYHELPGKKRGGRHKCPSGCDQFLRSVPVFHPEGLLGNRLFGADPAARRSRAAYIRLAQPVPHPLAPERKILVLYLPPPAMRPVTEADLGVNAAYRRILLANEQLRGVKERLAENPGDAEGTATTVGTPEPKVAKAQPAAERALIRAVAALFGRTARFSGNGPPSFRPLDRDRIEYQRSLPARLEGKAGLLRGYLLGKRADFSGRAVIVPDPALPFGCCRLPQRAAEALCRDLGRGADGVSDDERRAQPERLLRERPLLLNRAPSLHRYSFLAAELDPRRPCWDESTLAIHPLLCGGLGADFDGDTIAFHLPLGEPAVQEARARLAPRGHLFSVAHGGLMLHIAQDIVSGVYLWTRTPAGRSELAQRLNAPEIADQSTPVDGKTLTDHLSRLLRGVDRRDTQALDKALETVQAVMQRAFREVTEGGLSISVADLVKLMPDAQARRQSARECRAAAVGGVDPTLALREMLGQQVWRTLQNCPENAIAVMALSGARGNREQLARLCGAATALGAEDPPRCYVDGLNPEAYFEANKEARADMMKKKLGTPRGGDLTRKLVFGLYPLRITAKACPKPQALWVPLVFPFEGGDRPLHRHLLGKIAAKSVRGVLKAGDEITQDVLDHIAKKGVSRLAIYSAVTCSAKGGVCPRCYGWDVSTLAPPETGLAVGLLAAQSIGERATQDFMKAFQGSQLAILRNVEAAKRLMEWGRTEDIPASATAEILAWLVSVYDDKVNIRHFEMVLRVMCEPGELRGLVTAAQARAAAKSGAVSPLAVAAFRGPVTALAAAASEGSSDPLSTLPASLFVGRDGS